MVIYYVVPLPRKHLGFRVTYITGTEKVLPLEAMFCKSHSAFKPKNHIALEF